MSALGILSLPSALAALPGWFANLKDVLETMSSFVVIVGLPWGVYQYRRAAIKEQLDREYGTYHALDEKYLSYLEMCRQHPHLDVFDVPHPPGRALTAIETKQETIIFTSLISIFERAYLMYASETTDLKRRQWAGWDSYIRSFATRDNFVRAYRTSGTTFDTSFEAYMASILPASLPVAEAP